MHSVDVFKSYALSNVNSLDGAVKSVGFPMLTTHLSTFIIFWKKNHMKWKNLFVKMFARKIYCAQPTTSSYGIYLLCISYFVPFHSSVDIWRLLLRFPPWLRYFFFFCSIIFSYLGQSTSIKQQHINNRLNGVSKSEQKETNHENLFWWKKKNENNRAIIIRSVSVSFVPNHKLDWFEWIVA